MERNTDLEELGLYDFVPEQDLFCKQLAKSTKLKSLELYSLNGETEYDGYFAALATVLRENPSVPVCSFDFEDTGYKYPEWGPHDIHHLTALNAGDCRRKLRNHDYSGRIVVPVWSPVCPKKHAGIGG
jgi:hypothetical protein